MAVATGRVRQLYTTHSVVYVELDLPDEQRPLKGFFRMYRRSGNEARYTMLILAAAGSHRVEIRTSNRITPDRYGEISIVAVHFDAAA